MSSNERKRIFTFSIVQGNNSDLIRRVMKVRKYWVETNNLSQISNFKWTPVSQLFFFEKLAQNSNKLVK